MTQIASILAATDFSPPSRHAAERAARLARDSGARLTLTHVLGMGAIDALRELLGAQAAGVEQKILDEARGSLERLAAPLTTLPEPGAQLDLRVGSVLEQTLHSADQVEADLVVLGARGESFMRHLLLGSTAERLLRKTLRPLLVVRQSAHEAYRRVLVPVDFSPWSASALGTARLVAPHAELVVLHAFEVPFEEKLQFAGVDENEIHRYRIAAREDASRKLSDFVAHSGMSSGEVRLQVRHGEPTRTILEQEQQEDCDLVVMGKHGRGMVEELLLGSVTKHVVGQAAGDVLVAGAPRRS